MKTLSSLHSITRKQTEKQKHGRASIYPKKENALSIAHSPLIQLPNHQISSKKHKTPLTGKATKGARKRR